MATWAKLGEDAEEFLAFPVLVALGRRPMSAKELSFVLKISQDAVRRRCDQLEKLGYIVKRASDRRWVMVVRLVAQGVPQPTGVPGINPGVAESPVVDGIPVGMVVLEPPVPPGETVREAEARAQREAAEAASRRLAPQAKAQELAERYGVPVSFPDIGTISLGGIGECVACRRSSPLKYGATRLCAKCARVWGVVGEEVESVQDEAR